jgi:hypothetical protein
MKRLIGYAILAVIGYYLWRNHFKRLFQPKDQVKEILEEVQTKNEIGDNKRAVYLANQIPTSTIGDTPYAGTPLTAFTADILRQPKDLQLLPKGGNTSKNPFDRVVAWLNVLVLLGTLAGAGVATAAVPIQPGIYAKTVYVNASGTPIQNGRALTNAMKRLAQYQTLIVGPGKYWCPTNTVPSMAFSADNRVIHFWPGAEWTIGTTGGDPAYMFDDIGGKVTNVSVYGAGTFINTNLTSADVAFFDNGSAAYIECDTARNIGAGAILSWGNGSNHITLNVNRYADSDYDLVYGGGSLGSYINVWIRHGETFGDMLETDSDSPQWGLIYVHYGFSRSRGAAGQPSVAILSGRATLQVDNWSVERQAQIYSLSIATNGLAIGGNWIWPANSTNGVVNAIANSTTALRIKNASIEYPGPFDVFHITNSSTTLFTVENISLTVGSGPTNWVRGLTPSNVRVIGSLGINRTLGVGANVTLIGTNVYKTL